MLRSLPEWFGIEDATAAYIRDVRELEVFAVGEVGFLAVKRAHPACGGGLRHGNRAGAAPPRNRHALLAAAEEAARADSVEYLQVKTLGPSRESGAYARTRQFYEARGFVPLEELPDLWPGNPALLLVKRI